jgi:phosphopantothenoylcysteine decarboxylase / phosphopantothenate---cysteine ligase
MSSASVRRAISITACNSAYLASPTPGASQAVFRSARHRPPSPPKRAISSRPRSTALLPTTPVRKNTATSSASVSAPAPCFNSFSRGRASSGQSRIAIAAPPPVECAIFMESGPGIETVALAGKKILLGVTGGIAAYKAAELCRLLVKAGADVQVVMTAAAQQFVAPLTFQALSGKPVLASLWEAARGDGMEHIHLSRDADLLLVAPASADFLARLVHGRADDLLSTLSLARTCKLAVAPAMNREMWAAAPTQRNLAQLRADGVNVLGPAAGEQACGETGLGRMLEPAEILAALPGMLGAGPLAGKRVLITAGPTFEAIDPVRGLTNRSSGKMGYALAQAAAEAGAAVCLVSGPTCLAAAGRGAPHRRAKCGRNARRGAARTAGDVFIAVAAVADYRVDRAATQKIKKSDAGLTLNLVPIQTSWPRSPPCPMRRSAWVSPPRPSVWPSMPKPSA